MIRLFVRLYLAVLLVLAIAWAIQSYTFRDQGTEEERSRGVSHMVENILRGGARSAREAYENAPAAERSRRLEEINATFQYPVVVVANDTLPENVVERFKNGDDVVAMLGVKLFYVAPLSNGTHSLLFGGAELYRAQQPSQLAVMTGLGGILLIAAAAIAVLLRSVGLQLHAVEQTATAIAGGEFSARVDERNVKSASTLAQAFNRMADHVESMLSTQRELLQAVSHELRTPLSRIHFAIDLIRSSKDERERETRMTSLDAAAAEIDELLGELLQYVRLEASDLPMNKERVELVPLLEELIERQSLLDTTTRFEIGEELRQQDITLYADRSHLVRVLGNLLANAARYAEARVVINMRRSSSHTLIDVDDDGPGIPEADRERVFEPFVRGEESGDGTGLGLALVRRIVERYGGSVCALQSPLGGARLQISWAHANAEEAAMTDTAGEHQASVNPE